MQCKHVVYCQEKVVPTLSEPVRLNPIQKLLYAFFLRENNYILISICQVRLIQKDGLPGKM